MYLLYSLVIPGIAITMFVLINSKCSTSITIYIGTLVNEDREWPDMIPSANNRYQVSTVRPMQARCFHLFNHIVKLTVPVFVCLIQTPTNAQQACYTTNDKYSTICTKPFKDSSMHVTLTLNRLLSQHMLTLNKQ